MDLLSYIHANSVVMLGYRPTVMRRCFPSSRYITKNEPLPAAVVR